MALKELVVKMEGVDDQKLVVDGSLERKDRGNWVGDTIEACFEWVRYHGTGSATAYEEDGHKVCTVTLEIHE